jgi:hypothetical protein
MYIEPNVAMTEDIFNLVTRIPFNRPIAPPHNDAIIIAVHNGNPRTANFAHSTPVNATTLPTDKSIFPEIIRRQVAHPVIITIATCLETLLRFVKVKKASDANDETIIIIKRIPNIIDLCM